MALGIQTSGRSRVRREERRVGGIRLWVKALVESNHLFANVRHAKPPPPPPPPRIFFPAFKSYPISFLPLAPLHYFLSLLSSLMFKKLNKKSYLLVVYWLNRRTKRRGDDIIRELIYY